MDERERRQVKNEKLFRSINERIEQLATSPFDTGTDGQQVWDFVCECHDKNCIERIPLTVTEYENVRASGNRFVVAPGPEHLDTEIENVVDMSVRYWAVEKIGAAAEPAAEDDPRN